MTKQTIKRGFISTVKNFFTRDKSKKDDKKSAKSAKLRQFFSKISSSFFLIIAIMPFAGLFLGIGSALPTGSAAAAAFSGLGGLLFSNLGFFFALAIVVGFCEDIVITISLVWAYLIFLWFPSFILLAQNPHMDVNTSSVNFLFYHNVSTSVFGENLGINTLQTGVIGGLLMGTIVFVTFKYLSNIKLPSFLSFFQGKRLVPLLLIPITILYATAMCIAWPIFAKGLAWLGTNSAKLPAGLDSFIFFMVYRWLCPFGLHHAFYSILWWTPAGGTLNLKDYLWDPLANGGKGGYDQLWQYLHNRGVTVDRNGSITGDQSIWMWLNEYKIPFTTHFYSDPNGKHLLDLNPGRFCFGNGPSMMGGYVGAGLAMILAAEKGKRKLVAGVMGSGMITSAFIGITEPMIFSFIFVAPILYFGFHAFMCALGGMILNILHVHVGVTLSCGLIDLIIYGILPSSLGTLWWIVPIMAIIYFPIYFLVFYFYIKKTGRLFPVVDEKVGNTGTKEAFRSQRTTNVKDIVEGLGGEANLNKITNCATRMRVDVKDTKLINEKILRSTGAIAVIKSGNNVQIIYGVKAESIASDVKTQLGLT